MNLLSLTTFVYYRRLAGQGPPVFGLINQECSQRLSMKFSSKTEFVDRTIEQWELLWQAVDLCPGDRKSEAVVKQVLAHLHAWHRLTLGWYRNGLAGRPDLPAKGFNWQQTRQLNAKLDAEFKAVEMASVVRRLKLSHDRIMKLVDGLNEKQLFESGEFAWTGKHALMSYVAPNTFSHYRWAIKKIKKISKR